MIASKAANTMPFCVQWPAAIAMNPAMAAMPGAVTRAGMARGKWAISRDGGDWPAPGGVGEGSGCQRLHDQLECLAEKDDAGGNDDRGNGYVPIFQYEGAQQGHCEDDDGGNGRSPPSHGPAKRRVAFPGSTAQKVQWP